MEPINKFGASTRPAPHQRGRALHAHFKIDCACKFRSQPAFAEGCIHQKNNYIMTLIHNLENLPPSSYKGDNSTNYNIGDNSTNELPSGDYKYVRDSYLPPFRSDKEELNWKRHRCPSHRKKSIIVLWTAIRNICKCEPSECAGSLLLRFKGSPNSKEARESYGKIKRLLDELFKYHCGVLEFGANCQLHIHLIFIARDDIKSGFKDSFYQQYMFARKGFADGIYSPDQKKYCLKVLPKLLNPNQHLQELREKLNSRIMKFGFKAVRTTDIAPLVKDPVASANYITKQLWQPSTDFSNFVKHTRMIILPRSVPKPITRSFMWVGGKARKFRKKVALIAEYLGLDEITIKTRFGKSDWMDKIGFLMAKIQIENRLWPDYNPLGFDPAQYCRELVDRFF